MPRVLVSDDHGNVTLSERVSATDFESEHFRRQLADRISWAVTDAEANSPFASLGYLAAGDSLSLREPALA
jgi:hypothetical protein